MTNPFSGFAVSWEDSTGSIYGRTTIAFVVLETVAVMDHGDEQFLIASSWAGPLSKELGFLSS